MSWLMWGWAAAYLAGHLVLWHRVDREWLDPDDDRRDGHPGFAPPPNALTPAGEQLWRRAKRFTFVGFGGWVVLAVTWFLS